MSAVAIPALFKISNFMIALEQNYNPAKDAGWDLREARKEARSLIQHARNVGGNFDDPRMRQAISAFRFMSECDEIDAESLLALIVDIATECAFTVTDDPDLYDGGKIGGEIIDPGKSADLRARMEAHIPRSRTKKGREEYDKIDRAMCDELADHLEQNVLAWLRRLGEPGVARLIESDAEGTYRLVNRGNRLFWLDFDFEDDVLQVSPLGGGYHLCNYKREHILLLHHFSLNGPGSCVIAAQQMRKAGALSEAEAYHIIAWTIERFVDNNYRFLPEYRERNRLADDPAVWRHGLVDQHHSNHIYTDGELQPYSFGEGDLGARASREAIERIMRHYGEGEMADRYRNDHKAHTAMRVAGSESLKADPTIYQVRF